MIVTDLAGATDSTSFQVTVNKVDNLPVLQDDLITTDEDVAITFDPFINDDDDLGFDFSSISIIQQPSSGTLEVDSTTGEMTYRPNQHFNGGDQAQYQVKDTGGNDSNIATIQFTVNAINDKPVIESTPELNAIETVFYQYQIVATDVENEPLQITIPTLPTWLQFVGDQITGTPQLADVGNHNVVIQVSDGTDVTEQSFVINVRPFISGDLSVDQLADTNAALINNDFIITYRVSNSGPTEANNSSLDIEFSGDVSLVDMDPSCSGVLPAISCNLSTVALDETKHITITLRGNSVSDLYSHAQVISPDDPTLGNNESGLGISITETLMIDKATTVGEAASQLVVAGDIDDDGLEDIILLPGATSIGSVFINEGLSSFNKVSDIAGASSPTDAALAHINDDSNLDLVIATTAGQVNLVYYGDGVGGFSLGQTLQVSDANRVAVADINSDGLIDLVIANNGANDIYLNQAGTLLLSHQFGVENSAAVTVADIDGDSLPDAVFADTDGMSRFYNNSQLLDSANNNFSTTATGFVNDIQAIDINNDDVFELVVALGIDPLDKAQVPQNKLYEWSAGLSEIASFGRVDSTKLFVADIDGDTGSDLFVANSTGAHQIYLNDGVGLAITTSLLINDDATDPAWLFGANGLPNLLLAENLSEGSALYMNQGAGNFGLGVSDLALNYSISSNFANKGDTITVTYNVTNLGPSLSEGVVFEVNSGNVIQVVSSTSDVGACSNTDTNTLCDLGLLAMGDSVNISVQMKGIAKGRTNLQAMVSATTPDLVSENNSANFVVQINDLSGGGGALRWWLLLLLGVVVGVRRKYL